MKRREFLKLCGCFVLSTSISYKAFATLKNLNGENLPNFKLDIRPLTINVGATKPFKALHISDTHYTRATEVENQRKINLATARQKTFPWAEHYFDMEMDYARDKNLMVIHTGDFQDFITHGKTALRAYCTLIKLQYLIGTHELTARNEKDTDDEAEDKIHHGTCGDDNHSLPHLLITEGTTVLAFLLFTLHTNEAAEG